MIERNYPFDSFDIHCDFCSEHDNFEGDFYEVIKQAKESGWQISKVNGEWKHKCPACNEAG